MVSGIVQLNRYFSSAGGHPPVASGQISLRRPCRSRTSYRTTMPPTLPEPEALDQTTLLSVGSGVAHPLSPPPTPCHTLRGIPSGPPPPPPPPSPERLSPIPPCDGASCLLPTTL